MCCTYHIPGSYHSDHTLYLVATSITFIYTALCTGGDIISYVRPIAYVPLSCGDFGAGVQCLIAIHCAVPTLVSKYSWPPSRVRQGRRAERRRGASAERRPVLSRPVQLQLWARRYVKLDVQRAWIWSEIFALRFFSAIVSARLAAK